jgi:hypothetical protein
MHRFGKVAITVLVFVVFALSPVFGQMTMQQQGGSQGMSCCMMGGMGMGMGMGMGLMVTLSILVALLLLSATAAFVALAVFLLRRSRA